MEEVAQIKGFSLAFNLLQPAFSGNGIIQVLQKLSFSQIANVLVKEGTYTPNNDYEWLWQNIPPAVSPNFIFVQAPAPMNITIAAAGQLIVNAAPINKIFMALFPPGTIIDNVYFEGRPASIPLGAAPQGTPAQFFAILAKATC